MLLSYCLSVKCVWSSGPEKELVQISGCYLTIFCAVCSMKGESHLHLAALGGLVPRGDVNVHAKAHRQPCSLQHLLLALLPHSCSQQNVFVQLSLAFRNDSYTLESRINQAERERNLTEENTEKELENFKASITVIAKPDWRTLAGGTVPRDWARCPAFLSHQEESHEMRNGAEALSQAESSSES